MRKILHIFLSFVIVYASTTSAYAASPNGWAVSPADIIIGAAGNTVTAIKGAGSSALQSTVKHAPTAANIGKKIIKGGGAVAVAYAVTELIGAGVDWVLDPANNQVVYRTGEYGGSDLSVYRQMCIDYINTYYADNPAMRSRYLNSGVRIEKRNPDRAVCISYPWSSATIVTEWPMTGDNGEEKYLPISTVTAKVVSNAAAGHAESQELVKTAIIDDVNAGALDVPLNINAVPVADAPPVDAPPVDPDAPPVPFDPSSIISAIKSVMAAVVNMSGVLGAKIDALMIDLDLKQDETIEAVTVGAGAAADKIIAADKAAADKAAADKAAADEYFKDTPPDVTPEPVVVDTLPPTKGASDFDVNYINFGGQCPVLPSFDVGIGGASSALTFDMTPLCDMAVKIRPAVIAIAYFIGLGVIASAIRET